MEDYERRLVRLKAYMGALLTDPRFRVEARRVAEESSKWFTGDEWPVFFTDVRPLLSYDLGEALERRGRLGKEVPEGFVRYAFALRKLACDWGLGCSFLAVERAYELVESINRGREWVDVPGGDWEKALDIRKLKRLLISDELRTTGHALPLLLGPQLSR